jgi:triacylglycerol lipase
MLARVQKLISLGLLIGVFGAITLAIRLDVPALWAVPGVAVAGYAAVLAAEFWLLQRSYDRADVDRPGFAQLSRAWIAEVLGAPRVFLWRQPFRAAAKPDHLPDAAKGRRGVVFVHGFFCNRALWNPWMARLRDAGVPFIAVNLEPLFGSIDDYSPVIDAAVRELEHATALAPVIVAHSMGGLAVRAWLGARTAGERLHRLVTIATPHAGTRMARQGFGANILQMQPGSVWLARLQADEPSILRQRFVCFWGHCDNIVFPTRNATVAGADNRHLPATPHVQMVYHPAVIDEVLRLVAVAPSPSSPR